MSELGSPLSSLVACALDQVPESIIITDADLSSPGGPRIIYVNEAMLQLTGYDRNEVLGQSPKMLQGQDTDRDAIARLMKELVARGHAREAVLNYSKEGRPYWTELNISRVSDKDGKIVAYLSIQRDINLLQKLNEQYERDIRLISTAEKIARVGTWAYYFEDEKIIWSDGTYEIFEWEKSASPPTLTECGSFINEADMRMMLSLLENCIKKQTSSQVDINAFSSKGRPMRLKVLSEPMIGKNGRTVAVVGAVRDISDEQRLEAVLGETISQNRETEQYFAIARSIAKIGVFDYWIQHDRLHWSDELVEMTGLAKDLFPSKAQTILSRIDHKDRPAYLQLLDAAVSRHESFSTTVRFNRPDGKMMHMAVVADVRESDYGPRLVGIARDVTSDVEATHRLAVEQERFRIIADTVSDVLWDFDFERTSFWATPNWPDKLGIDLEDVGADPLQWLQYVIADDHDKVVGSIERALASGSDRWDCEFKVVNAQGSQAEIEVKSTILRHEDGEAYRILGNCRNITVEKRQQEGFTRSRALEAVGQMTGGIAHDFNNLLMIIQGNAELLEMKELSEDDADSVRLIMQASEAAASLTARLLSFSGQSQLHSVSVNVGKLVEDIAVLLRSGLTESISLKIVTEPGLWAIEVDGRALEQAIINLTVNARDAIGHEGGHVEISCKNVVFDDSMVGGNSGLAAGRYVCISVTDNGGGMSEQVKSRAFEPFYTTKDVGKGTGLGLSMVYGFARQSGGAIQIYSELGQGTTVNLYLPVSQSALVQKEKPSTEPKNHIRDGLRVLVVEDQPDVRSHVENLLVGAGIDVTSASDGKSALALLNGGRSFDLLFTDIIMPGGINGVQLADAAKALQPQLKVLFTSGFPASAFDELGLQRSEGFALLKKPYKRDELLSALARAL